MNLSKVLRKYTQTFDTLEKISEPPQQVAIRFNILYLGEIQGECFEVVIKDSAAGLGWLYGDYHAIVFKRSNNPLGVDLASLKELAETRFKTKQFLAQGMMPEPDKLQKHEDGKIVGFLNINDVMAISTIL